MKCGISRLIRKLSAIDMINVTRQKRHYTGRKVWKLWLCGLPFKNYRRRAALGKTDNAIDGRTLLAFGWVTEGVRFYGTQGRGEMLQERAQHLDSNGPFIVIGRLKSDC